MRKLILAVAITFAIAASSCTKENLAPAPKAVKLADKGNLSQADFAGDHDLTTPPSLADKGNLSQADGEGGH